MIALNYTGMLPNILRCVDNLITAIRKCAHGGQVASPACLVVSYFLYFPTSIVSCVQGAKGTFTVGVIGFPNVGKSTIINSLKRQRTGDQVCSPTCSTALAKANMLIHA